MKIYRVSQNDRKIPIDIVLAYTCTNEVILAEVWNKEGILVGNVNAILPTEFNDLPDGIAIGGTAGQVRTVFCNFTAIPVGTEYSLVFRTQNTGVLTKGPLFVTNKGGIYTPDDCKKTATASGGVITTGIGDKFLSDDGTYKYISGGRTKSKLFVWNTGDSYNFLIDDFEALHEFKINGISYDIATEFFSVLLKTVTVDIAEVELVDGDIVVIDYYPIPAQPVGDGGVFNDNYDEEFD
jgi:hypothetical protein